MGSVWRVSDGGGQVYAMKILRDSLNDDDLRSNVPARERLRREAMAMRKIRHQGVCQIVDMELDDAVAFIVTELIDGRNLKDDVAANGRYVGDDLERLASKLIDAVKAVHAAGIVHRDIKPTNVMVAARGPVLVDFGIAMGEGESHVTRTGLVMGTPGFIAPEIIDGAESNEATDWWSTAAVLAFAATGKPVFGTKPMMTVLERAASGNANLTGLPPRTMAAFRAALNPHPEERCTPDELLDAIRRDAMEPGTWEAAAVEEPGAGPTSGTGPTNAAPVPSVLLTPPEPPVQAAQPGDGRSGDDQPAAPITHNAETQVVRPFGAGFSAGSPPPEPPIAATRAMPEALPGTLPGASIVQPDVQPDRRADDDNPRTLWERNQPWEPPRPPMIVPAATLGQSVPWEPPVQPEPEPAPETPASKDSRSDLVVGLAVTALFAIAIITALIGL
ncbi:protein kinase [Bifidobacterium avesanii]|nr:protein kinase [Bifidobacterium avesanii]